MKKVTALYFSATLTTKKVTVAIANSLANEMGLKVSEIDITTPKQREQKIEFGEDDIVVFGSPVFSGRMPNMFVPYYKEIKGNGALGVAVAVYGNRAYDDGLIELTDIMKADGFKCVAAGAFIGEHSFTKDLATGRPNEDDLKKAEKFGTEIAEEIKRGDEIVELKVPGNAYPFYKAIDTKGKVDMSKVVPVTDSKLCLKCGYCAEICPMGAINKEDFSKVDGICIKCGACIKRCPQGAKCFTDEVYISCKNMLVEKCKGLKCEPEMFFGMKKK